MTRRELVRRLAPTEWENFRTLRLPALRTDALAFGSTSEREEGYPESKWQEWTLRGATGASEATFVLADDDGSLFGMCGCFPEAEAIHIWGMWVEPAHRGLGVGTRLLDAVLAWMAESAPRAPALLDVNPEQRAAVQTYLSRGFRFTGVERPLGHHSPARIREMRRSGGSAAGNTA